MATLSERSTALRTYAEAMPVAINKMKDSCARLLSVFHSVEEGLGSRSEDVLAAILAVQKFVEASSEPILMMPERLNAKAEEIDAYLSSTFGGGNPT